MSQSLCGLWGGSPLRGKVQQILAVRQDSRHTMDATTAVQGHSWVTSSNCTICGTTSAPFSTARLPSMKSFWTSLHRTTSRLSTDDATDALQTNNAHYKQACHCHLNRFQDALLVLHQIPYQADFYGQRQTDATDARGGVSQMHVCMAR